MFVWAAYHILNHLTYLPSPSLIDNLKHGNGSYEYGADSSMLSGVWDRGDLKTGQWIWRNAGHYEGGFVMGRPMGPGVVRFASGLEQQGAYVKRKAEEGEEEPEEGAQIAPNTTWQGDSIVSF
ncbi:hypothetical protein EON64_16320 [archaeon]|nr:MAG: hypothetical protein EON64_16320 [archaeon]